MKFKESDLNVDLDFRVSHMRHEFKFEVKWVNSYPSDIRIDFNARVIDVDFDLDLYQLKLNLKLYGFKS